MVLLILVVLFLMLMFLLVLVVLIARVQWTTCLGRTNKVCNLPRSSHPLLLLCCLLVRLGWGT